MNADTPSSASEMTWNATSSRLCRFTMRASSRRASCRRRALPSRRRTARGRTVRRGAGWRRRRSGAIAARADGVGERLGRGSSTSKPVSPGTTVSSAPPRPSATTGRPHACASSGTMPKSSSPGSSTTAARRYSSRTSSSRQAAEKLDVGADSAAGARARRARGRRRRSSAARRPVRQASIASSMRL